MTDKSIDLALVQITEMREVQYARFSFYAIILIILCRNATDNVNSAKCEKGAFMKSWNHPIIAIIIILNLT